MEDWKILFDVWDQKKEKISSKSQAGTDIPVIIN